MENSLQSRPIKADYASGCDVFVSDDIDSVMMLCCTVEPLRCVESAQLNLRLARATIVRNKKTTLYLAAAVSTAVQSRLPSSRDRENHPWHEFSFLAIAGRPVFAAFQCNLECPFFRDIPVRSTFAKEGRLRTVYTAFINEVVFPSARRILAHALTARAELVFIKRDLDRTYPVYQRNYATSLLTSRQCSPR